MDLRGRSLLKETDLNADEFLFLVDLARQVRAEKRDGVTGQRLAGRNIALIFEKTSTGATLGMDARICAPATLQPSAEVRGIAAGLAAGSGARLVVTDEVMAGVAGVDFVYTDVWLSLGEPEDEWGSRIDQLLPYQVNSAVRGGIPVVADASGTLRGVEAVVDKDLTAALLARAVNADALLLLTDVDAVIDGFGTPDARPISHATPAELRARSFPAGSMGPKVEAACRFVEATGKMAAIGRLDAATALLRREAGTIISP
jgi:hypothetical protein